MRTEQQIKDLSTKLDEQLVRVRALRSLPLVLLERKPDPKRWSVLEICEHLNLNSGHYLAQLRKAYDDPRSRFTHRSDHEPGFWGGMLTRTMQPTQEGRIRMPMSTLRLFEPLQAPVKRMGALDELITMLEGYRALLDVAAARGMEGPRITSTLGPVLRFRIADAFGFTTAHQERHLLQIERTLQALKA